MKSKRNLIIGALVLALVIAGAVVAYQRLSDSVELVPPPAQQEPQAPAAGFSVEDSEGNTVALADIEGPVVLNFWTTWCPSCTRMLPALQAAYEQFGSDVKFMMINLVGSRGETPARSQAFVEEQGYAFPLYFDTGNEAGRAFAVRYLPTTVFINSDGVEIHRQVGTMSESALIEQIERIR